MSSEEANEDEPGIINKIVSLIVALLLAAGGLWLLADGLSGLI